MSSIQYQLPKHTVPFLPLDQIWHGLAWSGHSGQQAPHFLQSQEADGDVPRGGECPDCGKQMSWLDALKAAGNVACLRIASYNIYSFPQPGYQCAQMLAVCYLC